MAYWLLEYDLVDDYVERRAALRQGHLGLAREAYVRGDLLLAGALAEPVDRAVLVWRVDDPSVIEDFARRDPDVVQGIVRSWRVRPWTVVVGEGAASV